MEWKKEWKALLAVATVFPALYFLPVEALHLGGPVNEALALTHWYAQEHVILCLVPAFFIAGAISSFVSRASVMKYLGPGANRTLAYGVASVSGSILAVCSCTVLPLFAGIYRMGAGLGPATAFLYSGPAINVLAIVLTARVLGLGLGVARAVGAVAFSVLIGIAMHLIFRSEERESLRAPADLPDDRSERPLWRTGVYFAAMVGILVFANWGRPVSEAGLWHMVYTLKWPVTAALSILLGAVLVAWFGLAWWKAALAGAPAAILGLLFPGMPVLAFGAGALGLSVVMAREGGELSEWLDSTWSFTKQILPLLLLGVLIAGALLGRPGHEGLVPSAWISRSVGGNSLAANLFASAAGAFMYFATLTEVPILQGLIGSGMGQGPALALLLAGPALSLPSMIVLNSILGTRKTVVYVLLVIFMAALSGLLYGWFSQVVLKGV
jgi:uncharacterized protein